MRRRGGGEGRWGGTFKRAPLRRGHYAARRPWEGWRRLSGLGGWIIIIRRGGRREKEAVREEQPPASITIILVIGILACTHNHGAVHIRSAMTVVRGGRDIGTTSIHSIRARLAGLTEVMNVVIHRR